MIKLADCDKEILACYSLMNELRPSILENEFLNHIQRQKSEGYRLAYLKDEDSIVSLAGFRIRHSLAWGCFMYVDDLVTHEKCRSSGYGEKLLCWLKSYAVDQGCVALHLDSGVQRKDAHRFYENQGMEMSCLHFHAAL